MNWDTLKAFIEQKDPEYLQQVKGIPAEDIKKCEEKLGISLPGGYKDLLEIMGGDTNFNILALPYGAVWDFYELTKNVPSSHYPASQLFRIGHDAQNHIGYPMDLFIDLTKSDGYDAALLEYGAYNKFDPGRIERMQLSLMELLTKQIVLKFENITEDILIFNYKKIVMDTLLTMGLSEALPPQENISYLTGADAKVLVEFYDDEEMGPETSVYLKGETAAIEDALDALPELFIDPDPEDPE